MLALTLGTFSAAGIVRIDRAQASDLSTLPISERHRSITREIAAEAPRREDHQVVVDGWPLYRTERGQEAFNHAMATLRATDRPGPPKEAFSGCTNIQCRLALPQLTRGGWIPAGRLWVSPDAYVLIVHSPRRSKYDAGRRRSYRSMRYFVFHEFQNSSRNTDLYDTISAHRRSVFVPFYLGKPGRDAKGRQYVVVVQVAPHDIVSRHAAVFGNAGPGIEVAKNRGEPLQSLQATAGIIVARIVAKAHPRIRMVHHRNTEGLPMLRAYQRRRTALKRLRGSVRRVRLPFVPASQQTVAAIKGGLQQLIVHAGPVRQAPRREPQLALGVLRPTLAASLPQLVSKPQLVRAIRTPLLTMEKLLERVLSDRGSRELVPPKPQLVR